MAAARKPSPTSNPAAAEALDAERITFTHDGVDYATTPTSEWTLDALEAYENGRILTLLREVLLDGGYDRFRETHTRVADLTDLFQALAEALGLAGNR